jgi:hypothetical protein
VVSEVMAHLNIPEILKLSIKLKKGTDELNNRVTTFRDNYVTAQLHSSGSFDKKN